MITKDKLYFIIESDTGLIDGWYKFYDNASFETEAAELCAIWDDRRERYKHYPCILDSNKSFYLHDTMHLTTQWRAELEAGFILKRRTKYESGVRNMSNALIETVVEVCGDRAISIQNLINISDAIRQNDGHSSDDIIYKYGKTDIEGVLSFPLKKKL